jgi:hypothetical protein
MTVAELRALISGFPDDLPVYIAANDSNWGPLQIVARSNESNEWHGLPSKLDVPESDVVFLDN